jgi:DNA processing protein
LYARGNIALLNRDEHTWRSLCVIGSRKHSRHGQEACNLLLSELAGQPIIIVSGLALGLDALAHDAALKAGLPTIAIIASSLEDDYIYPRAHVGLAQSILEHDGLLISMHEREHRPRYHDFPARNVLMATLSQSTLIIEAGEKSGTLITARFAIQENRDVLVVPHSIVNAAAVGSNSLLRQGATPVTCAADILESLNLPHSEDSASLFGTFPHAP